MAIKSFKPYTPSRRNMTVSAFDGVDKKAKPVPGLLQTVSREREHRGQGTGKGNASQQREGKNK